MTVQNQSEGSFLRGIRVLEVADELGEFCGKILAGLGADVVKIEPPGGEVTRTYGPFFQDVPHPDRSLYFWHYNFGKRSAILDLHAPTDAEAFRALVSNCDVVIDARQDTHLDQAGLGYSALREINPQLIFVRISPFGIDGPWAGYTGSDLIHLALGGVMMNCGYDPEPSGYYETPPIAPAMWHAYHIVGEVTAIQIIAALHYSRETGVGQFLSSSVHDAVSKNTETDVPDWVYAHQPHYRQTCRHSLPQIQGSSIARTKDGRWILPYRTYLRGFETSTQSLLGVLDGHGMGYDLHDPKYADIEYLRRPEASLHVGAIIETLVGKYTYDRDIWKDGQEAGLTWGPLRRPEENLADEHWGARETFIEVDYPELDTSFKQVGAMWLSPGLRWRTGPRAPRVGEHTEAILSEATSSRKAGPSRPFAGRARSGVLSPHGKPFALDGVRVVDLSWMLASAGAGRFFTALGADVIKVEHESKPDGMRLGVALAPRGLRPERDASSGPIATVPIDGELNRSGMFMEINAGKRGLSLNLKSVEGRAILAELLEHADILTEGFSPGTMDAMGFGYEQLRAINPRIIYVQQSGMGQVGTYGKMRSFGPTAQAFSGLSEMSGLKEPFAPAGIGYSFLDWFGAYQMALAMMAGLVRRQQTGEGCWIDSSQVESGIYLTGTSILDYTANGRGWQRYGNASPHRPAAPHGAFRARGEDRWIAIAAFTDEQWESLVDVLGESEWRDDPRLSSLSLRQANAAHLEQIISGATLAWDAFELMAALQDRGVPAGVCQTAEDRCDRDPQLRHLGWQLELDQAEIGRWPVKDVPVSFSETPPYIGGLQNRSGPSYGQDTEAVLADLLGYTSEEIAAFRRAGVV